MKLYEFFNIPIDPLKKPDPHFDHISAEEKEKLANEVFWFILDNDSLHKEYVLPEIQELKKVIDSPNFNRDKFSKKWEPMVAKGCNQYYKKEKLKKSPNDLFDSELKTDLCKKLTDRFIDDIKDDAYNIGEHKL